MMDRRRFLVAGGSSLLLAACGVPVRDEPKPETNIELQELEKQTGGRLGVALVDSEGRLIWHHRAAERFAMCSTFKLPLAGCLLEARRLGLVDRHAEITLSQNDLVPYAPFVEERLKSGQPTTMTELASAAVRLSDNAAANILLKRLEGPAGLTRLMRSRGDETSRLDRIEPELNQNASGDMRDTTTPAAMASLYYSLVISAKSDPSDRELLQEWMMQSTTGSKRIRAGVPKRWTVGDKTGTTTGSAAAYCDVAIIWPGNGVPEYNADPFILAVYLDRPDVEAAGADTAIAEVARKMVRLTGMPG